MLAKAGVFLAAQCCEHLNRAIVLEQAALKPWQQPVNVLPQPHAGGSFATTAWQNMKAPTALEAIEADAGLDIGDTLIGMHLKARGRAGAPFGAQAGPGEPCGGAHAPKIYWRGARRIPARGGIA